MDIMKLMKQAKTMQGRMSEMQKELAEREVSGQSGGGLVQVTITCRGVVRSLKISPSAITPSEPELLEDLVKAALNDARSRGDQLMAEETRKMMRELGLPEDGSLPF